MGAANPGLPRGQRKKMGVSATSRIAGRMSRMPWAVGLLSIVVSPPDSKRSRMEKRKAQPEREARSSRCSGAFSHLRIAPNGEERGIFHGGITQPAARWSRHLTSGSILSQARGDDHAFAHCGTSVAWRPIRGSGVCAEKRPGRSHVLRASARPRAMCFGRLTSWQERSDLAANGEWQARALILEALT